MSDFCEGEYSFLDGIGFELVTESGDFGDRSDGKQENVGECENEEVSVHSARLGEFYVVHAEPPVAIFEVAKHRFYPHAFFVKFYDCSRCFPVEIGHEKPGFVGLAVVDGNES